MVTNSLQNIYVIRVHHGHLDQIMKMAFDLAVEFTTE